MKDEENFHDERILSEGEKNIERVGFAYHPIEYARNEWINSLKNLGKTLEVGVWKGDILFKVHKESESFTGIDLSSEAIKLLEKRTDTLKLSKIKLEHIDFFDLPEDFKFDSIIMSGVLHHLDLKKVIKKIGNILNKNGKFYLWEPLPGPMLLRFFRFLTPNLRTEDEAPLSQSFLDELKNEFPSHNLSYCGSSIAITAPMAIIKVNKNLLYKVDKFFTKKNFFEPWVIYGYFSK